MAIGFSTKIPVAFGTVFEHGAFLAPGTEVQEVKEWNDRTRSFGDQARDKDSELPLWKVTVIDGDPEARLSEKTVEVVIPAKVRPVIGGAFTSVEFEGLTASPKAQATKNGARLVWYFRATGVHPLNGAKPAHKPEG
jgi:hypothetical protein